MNRKPQLSDAIRAEIDAVLDRSGEAYRAGQLRRSLAIAEEAWNMIPLPPYDWDYYAQSLSADFVRDYAELGDVGEVEKWIPHLYAAYGDAEKTDHYTLMTEAEARLQIGQRDAAITLFKRLYDLFGPEGFRGEHRQYLALAEAE